MTIKQLADELGVNKRKIVYRVNNLSNEKYIKKNNVVYINEQGINEIKSIFLDKSKTKNDIKEHIKDNANVHTKNMIVQLEKKDEQIKGLQQALKTQQQLLDQQQRLHLQANQRIEMIEKQLIIEVPEAEPQRQENNPELEQALFKKEERIKELEKQVAEDEKINKELYAEYERLSHLEEAYQNKPSKKWHQFWK